MQGTLPIYSGHVALSVVDNVLLIHEIASKVVLIYDVMSDSKVPISAPLTLLIRGVPSCTSSRTASELENSHGGSSSAVEHSETVTTEAEANVYDGGWVFANPNIVLDKARGLLWKIHLDLEVCSAISVGLVSVGIFRRVILLCFFALVAKEVP